MNLKKNRSNKTFQIHLVAAARPNFMKIAPLYHAIKKEDWADPIIVHTGQHYDLNMSGAFFEDLALPEPHIHLGIGSGTHAEQTGNMMISYEKILMKNRPDLVVVVGDVNSTLACALAAAKLQISVGHLEAGLRSFDRTMPEELNRLVTDTLADILWTPSPDADENLIREGISRAKIIRVGNIMIDSLEMLREKINNEAAYKEFALQPGKYGLITLHRPSNVDDQEVLKQTCQILTRISHAIPLVFPIHPRTRRNLRQNGLMTILNESCRLHIVEPLNYIRFMSLLFDCQFAITDSGGIQEETTYLGIPCLTMRPNTERPVTIHQGTNHLCSLGDLENQVKHILSGKAFRRTLPQYWDGHTATRVVSSIKNFFFTE